MLVLPASAFLVTILGFLVALKLFPILGLTDFPERYGLTRSRLSYPAGIVSVIVFLLFFVSSQPWGAKEIGVVIAVVLLVSLSFVDDRSPLPSSLRLLVHVLAALIVFVAGARIYSITNPMGGILKLDEIVVTLGSYGSYPLWSAVFTIFWLLLTTNAMNWFDGIPGQVHVIATIGFVMIGFLAFYRNGQTDVALIAFILAGISGAGLFFDFPPARLLIGDSGAMFFGFMLGLLGIYQGGKVATAFLAVGLPLLDAGFVILRRLIGGRSPFKGGRDHLHHLLLDRGWSPKQVIALTACIGTAFGVAALFLDTETKALALVLLVCIVLLLTRSASRN